MGKTTENKTKIAFAMIIVIIGLMAVGVTNFTSNRERNRELSDIQQFEKIKREVEELLMDKEDVQSYVNSIVSSENAMYFYFGGRGNYDLSTINEIFPEIGKMYERGEIQTMKSSRLIADETIYVLYIDSDMEVHTMAKSYRDQSYSNPLDCLALDDKFFR